MRSYFLKGGKKENNIFLSPFVLKGVGSCSRHQKLFDSVWNRCVKVSWNNYLFFVCFFSLCAPSLCKQQVHVGMYNV